MLAPYREWSVLSLSGCSEKEARDPVCRLPHPCHRVIPGDVPKLSVIHYLKSILKGMIGVTPLTIYRTDISPGVAALVLAGFSIVMVVLTMLVFSQMEFRQKA